MEKYARFSEEKEKEGKLVNLDAARTHSYSGSAPGSNGQEMFTRNIQNLKETLKDFVCFVLFSFIKLFHPFCISSNLVAFYY